MKTTLERLAEFQVESQKKLDQLRLQHNTLTERFMAKAQDLEKSKLAPHAELKRLNQLRLEYAEANAQFAYEVSQVEMSFSREISKLFLEGARQLEARGEQPARAWLLAFQECYQLAGQWTSDAKKAATVTFEMAALIRRGPVPYPMAVVAAVA